MNLKQKDLEKIIEEVLFEDKEPPITVYTGTGGCIEYAKAWLAACGHDNPTNERLVKEVKSMIAAGWITPMAGGLFKISS